MGFQKQGQYKVLNGDDLIQKLSSLNITPDDFMDDGHCFGTYDITVAGQKSSYSEDSGTGKNGYFSSLGLRVYGGAKGGQNNYLIWEKITSKIPGLHCPYCHAQAFHTDHPNIAVCGACPSWYFYYLEEYNDNEDGSGIHLELRNGEWVEVEGDNRKDNNGISG